MTTCFGTVRPGIPGAGHQLVIKKMTVHHVDEPWKIVVVIVKRQVITQIAHPNRLQ